MHNPALSNGEHMHKSDAWYGGIIGEPYNRHNFNNEMKRDGRSAKFKALTQFLHLFGAISGFSL